MLPKSSVIFLYPKPKHRVFVTFETAFEIVAARLIFVAFFNSVEKSTFPSSKAIRLVSFMSLKTLGSTYTETALF